MAKKDYFDNDNDNQSEGKNEDENFGLPEIDYKPLEASESSPASASSGSEGTTTEKSTYSYTPMEEPKSNAPLIITIIIALVVVVAGYLIYQYVYVPSSEKARKEAQAKLDADKKRKEEAARLAKEKEEAEQRRIEAEKAAAENAKPAQGTIETLSGRTGRYYVVISSAIDDDLTMDYAKKLSLDGNHVKIVPPFGKSKFYRLTISDYETFADAQANADAVKAKYGDAVWVLKY
jgi:hypothetical protein